MIAVAMAALLMSPAQAEGGLTPVERFRPSLQRDAIFDVVPSTVPAHLKYDLALWFDVAIDPLDGDPAPVGARSTAHLTFAIGLFDFLQVGGELPFIVGNGRDPRLARLTAFGLGDLRLHSKVSLLKSETDLVELAFFTELTVPNHFPRQQFLGEPGFTVTPGLSYGGLFGEVVRYTFNLAYLVRAPSSDGGVNIGPELLYKAGLGYRLKQQFDWPVEVQASIAGELGLPGETHDLELNAGATWSIDDAAQIVPTLGFGLIDGHAAPDVRFAVGLRYSPRVFDEDSDGVSDSVDKCPGQMEDRDGFQDLDGCVDPDDDNDGILDIDDACRNVAEDIDLFEDEDGCPEADNDNDGIHDRDDACPMRGEDKDDFQDEDGCPDVDNDEDGVLDDADKCPLAAGPSENGGCPWPDSDGDGVDDSWDRCPSEVGATRLSGCTTGVLIDGNTVELVTTLYAIDGVLTARSRAELQPLVAHMSQTPGKLELRGPAIVEAIKRALVESGVPAGRIVTVSGEALSLRLFQG